MTNQINDTKQDGRESGLLATACSTGSVDPLQVMNDISEDIDNGETRKQLREVIKWWACSHDTMARITQQQRQEIELLRLYANPKDIAAVDEIICK